MNLPDRGQPRAWRNRTPRVRALLVKPLLARAWIILLPLSRCVLRANQAAHRKQNDHAESEMHTDSRYSSAYIPMHDAFELPVPVDAADIDELGHVNNLVY